MPLAIFGISNGGLNLVATLFVMALVVVWLALIVWTYFDASRRIEDPVLVACATAASLFPFIGTFVYSILRPPEFLDDAKERELEIKAAELRVRQLSELACPNCNYPVEKSYLRCPNCQRRLKDPCESCGKPVDRVGRSAPTARPRCRGASARRGRPSRDSESRAAERLSDPLRAALRRRRGPRSAPPRRPPARASRATPTAVRPRPPSGRGRSAVSNLDR